MKNRKTRRCRRKEGVEKPSKEIEHRGRVVFPLKRKHPVMGHISIPFLWLQLYLSLTLSFSPFWFSCAALKELWVVLLFADSFFDRQGPEQLQEYYYLHHYYSAASLFASSKFLPHDVIRRRSGGPDKPESTAHESCY